MTLPHPLAFDAVLFDMDGTLIDSEPIWFDVTRDVALDFGCRLPDGAHAALHGQDRATSTRILEGYGLAGDIEAFWGEVIARLAGALARVQPMPNAGAWVEAVVAGGRARALVSNSPRAMIDASLAPQAWGRHLQVRIGIEDVPRGKPEPHGYLLAAARLGVDIRRCLVIEDSLAGARAGVAAGATTLFVTNGVIDEAVAAAITPHVVPALPAL